MQSAQSKMERKVQTKRPITTIVKKVRPVRKPAAAAARERTPAPMPRDPPPPKAPKPKRTIKATATPTVIPGVEIPKLSFDDKLEAEKTSDVIGYKLNKNLCWTVHEDTVGAKIGDASIARPHWLEPHQLTQEGVTSWDSRGNLVGIDRIETTVTNLLGSSIDLKSTSPRSIDGNFDEVSMRADKQYQKIKPNGTVSWSQNYSTLAPTRITDGLDTLVHISDFYVIVPNAAPANAKVNKQEILKIPADGDFPANQTLKDNWIWDEDANVVDVRHEIFYVVQRPSASDASAKRDNFKMYMATDPNTLLSLTNTTPRSTNVPGIGRLPVAPRTPSISSVNYDLIGYQALGLSMATDDSGRGYAYLSMLNLGRVKALREKTEKRVQAAKAKKGSKLAIPRSDLPPAYRNAALASARINIMIPAGAGLEYDEDGEDLGWISSSLKWNQKLTAFVVWDYLEGAPMTLPADYEGEYWVRSKAFGPAIGSLQIMNETNAMRERDEIAYLRDNKFSGLALPPRDATGKIPWAVIVQCIQGLIQVIKIAESLYSAINAEYGPWNDSDGPGIYLSGGNSGRAFSLTPLRIAHDAVDGPPQCQDRCRRNCDGTPHQLRGVLVHYKN
jgi:hypothetical protein